MQGGVEKIVTSANLDIIILKSTNAEKNTLFVFEQFKYSQEELQQAWSKWVFPFDVVDFDFIRDSLTVVYREGDNLFTCVVNLYSRISEQDNIFLDKKVVLPSSDGINFTIPANYDMTNVTAVVVSGNFMLNTIGYTVSGDTLTLKRTIAGDTTGKIALGVPFESAFKLTRPFVRDREGRVTTEDKLSVSRFILHLINTGSVVMRTMSDYYDTVEQKFVSRTVGGLNARLGTRSVFTGDQKFSFGHDASQATAEFTTSDHLGLTVAGISWVGQYHQTRRKL